VSRRFEGRTTILWWFAFLLRGAVNVVPSVSGRPTPGFYAALNKVVRRSGMLNDLDTLLHGGDQVPRKQHRPKVLKHKLDDNAGSCSGTFSKKRHLCTRFSPTLETVLRLIEKTPNQSGCRAK
jgi:hypothetical protein